MSFADDIAKDQKEEIDRFNKIKAKYGNYTEISCPHCGRHRVMLGEDGNHRCEKCHWCVETNDYDLEMFQE